MNIASAGNAHTACLQAVMEKGFAISVLSEKDDETLITYFAKRGDDYVSAENGIELFGLVCLLETYGAKWQELLEKKPYDNIDYGDE